MTNRQISRMLYFLIISTLTELVLLILAVIALLPTGILNDPITVFVAGYMIYYGIKVALLFGFMSRWYDPELLTRLVGHLPGRLIGLMVGAAVGNWLGGMVVSILGAVSMYLVGRWLGSRISLFFGSILRQFSEFPAEQEIREVPVLTRTRRLVIVGFLFSMILVLVALLMFEWMDIRITSPTDILPYARIYGIIVSLFTVVLPWILENRILTIQLVEKRALSLNPAFIVVIFGVACSYIPTILGFVMYFLGAGLMEAMAYMVVSMLSMSVWVSREIGQSGVAG